MIVRGGVVKLQAMDGNGTVDGEDKQMPSKRPQIPRKASGLCPIDFRREESHRSKWM